MAHDPLDSSHLCFVSDRVKELSRADSSVFGSEAEDPYKMYIRYEVCFEAPLQKHDDGNWYCIMHLPQNGFKRCETFWEIFGQRMESGQYDFQYVYFPLYFPGQKYPVFNDRADFTGAVFEKNCDFDKCVFNDDVDFSLAVFKGPVSFNGTVFNGQAAFNETFFSRAAHFEKSRFKKPAFFRDANFAQIANFTGARFKNDADFRNGSFNGATNFSSAEFRKKTIFDRTIFSDDVDFNNAVFEKDSSAFFVISTFIKRVTFQNAYVKGEITFQGSKKNRVFQHSDHNVELQSIRTGEEGSLFFKSLHLRPSWFINCDVQNFVFIDVNWGWKDKIKFGTKNYVSHELKTLRSKNINERLLRIAYRQLADCAEKNNRYEEASEFRFMAMDCERRSKWNRRSLLIRLYRFSSGYGEKWPQALLILFLIWLIPFLFYLTPYAVFARETGPTEIAAQMAEAFRAANDPNASKPGQTEPAMKTIQGQSPRDAIFYSLNTMAFQKPEPKPANESWLTRLMVILQTILGPVQATLLLLAIRRKFMR